MTEIVNEALLSAAIKRSSYEEEEKVLKYTKKKFRMSHNIGEQFPTKCLFPLSVVGEDQRIYIWRKPEESWRPNLVHRPEQRPVKVLI